jgi:hypothetical protein
MKSILDTPYVSGKTGMAATCPVCGSEDVDLWLGGQGVGSARAWIASAARAWYHCRECNYLGPLHNGAGSQHGGRCDN